MAAKYMERKHEILFKRKECGWGFRLFILLNISFVQVYSFITQYAKAEALPLPIPLHVHDRSLVFRHQPIFLPSPFSRKRPHV